MLVVMISVFLDSAEARGIGLCRRWPNMGSGREDRENSARRLSAAFGRFAVVPDPAHAAIVGVSGG